MATTTEQIVVDIEIEASDIGKTESEIIDLTGEILKLEKQVKSNKIELKKSDEELQKEGKTRKEIAVLVAKQQQALQKVRKERTQGIKVIKSEEYSLNSLMAQTNKLNASRNKQNLATVKGRQEFAKLTTQINKNNVALKKYDAQIERNQRNVGNYPTFMSKAKAGIGAMAGAVGAAITVVMAFSAALAHTFELAKITTKVTTLFGATGVAAEEMAAKISALSTALETDYEQILISANAVSKEFGISGNEALSLIEEGFKKGSNNSGEFLDILREYPVQLKSVGLNAEESFAIINQQVTAGVYSDKGIDAIKEAGLALRENTVATQAALAPLSEQIKLQIKQEIAAGNTFKAMQLISTEMKTAGLTTSQTGAIMADVFKGAGEDSLSFVQNLDNVSLSLEGVANQTTDVEDATLTLDTAWNSFLLSMENGDGIISKSIAAVKNGVAGFLDGVSDLNNGYATIAETDDRAKRGLVKWLSFGLIDATNTELEEQIKIRKANAMAIENEAAALKLKTEQEAKAAGAGGVGNEGGEDSKSGAAGGNASGVEKEKTKITASELAKRQREHDNYVKNVIAGETKIKDLQISLMDEGFAKDEALLQQKHANLVTSYEGQFNDTKQLNVALALENDRYLQEVAGLYAASAAAKFEKERADNALFIEDITEHLAIVSETELLANETLNINKALQNDNFRAQELEKESIFDNEKFQKGVEIANAGVDLALTLNDRKLANLETNQATELANAEGNEDAIAAINVKYAKKKAKIERQNFLFEKAQAVANTGINIAAAIAKALPNPVLASLAGVLGAVQLATIVATPAPTAPTFAQGGAIVQGGSHASGNDVGVYGDNGQYFGRVQGDEGMYVMKKESQQALAMSNFNQQFGGRSFASAPKLVNADGGALGAQTQQTDFSEVVNAIANMNIVVGVQDITDAQATQTTVVDNATF